MYKSKTRRKKASPVEKAQSTLQRRLYQRRCALKELGIKNMLRLEQNRRDHNFLEIIKKYSPEAYTKAVEIWKEKYPNLKKLDELKKELRENKE